MNIKKPKSLLIITASAILAFGFGASAQASGMRISPLTYNFEISPGESQIANMVITNRNETPLNYVTEVELFSNVSEEGAPSFTANPPQTGITTLMDWIEFDSDDNEGVIAPGEEKEINFTINVPEGAEPGGHYAGVFAKEIKKSETGATQLGVASRLGLLVLVSVPGKVTKTGVITDFIAPKFVWRGPIGLQLKVKNTGSVHYDSEAEISAKSLIGSNLVAAFGEKPDGEINNTRTVIPGNTRLFEAKIDKKYPFGRYVITATALDGDDVPMTATAVVWALPLIIIIPVLAGLLLLIIIIKYLRTHLRFVSEKDNTKIS